MSVTPKMYPFEVVAPTLDEIEAAKQFGRKEVVESEGIRVTVIHWNSKHYVMDMMVIPGYRP